jgi:biotin carboxyl carrier protein
VENNGSHRRFEILIRHTAIVSGENVEVVIERSVDRIQATVNGRTYSLELVEVAPDLYWFNSDQGSHEIAVIREPSGYVVSMGGHRIPVEIVDPRKALLRASHSGHDGAIEIRAPMPGKIVRVLAEENVAIAANSGIVVMEAMKMQNEIKSPKAGTVRKLGVTQGAAVNAGDLIAVVE